ncbi:ribose transport system permease protein [Nocardioides sp. J9]|uniref:ABC transporter permease n=1 Tax=Nocardioides sp. J9 TaxID=935844 RepID=UPI0011A1EB68|nr:ABC transporter permease [Nocardioides sp. J9]TWG96338.1 ribose transport system permease protein [Nocardioides sp. J9]
MTLTTSTPESVEIPTPERPPTSGSSVGTRVLGMLSPNKVSALYVLAVIVIFFSIRVPETFPKSATVSQVLNGNAVIGLAALSIVIPLSARVFDLSFAYTMSLSGVTAAYFVVEREWSTSTAIAAALAVSLVVGVINAFVVVILRVDSLIGTLATGSLIQAFITFVTNEVPITGSALYGSFSDIGQKQALGVTLPVIYMFVLAAALWFLMEHTAMGRRIYATGFNTEAARLSGIPTKRIQFCSLLVSAVLAGWAGITLAAVLGSGSPTAGTPYLLPAFAAAFLGATQLRPGRFNAWGTMLGVITLGAGTTGLALAASPPWAANMFTGIVLIAALAVTTVERSGGRSFRLRRKGKHTEAAA